MIKRALCYLVLSFSVLITCIQAVPRTYYSIIPPAIRSGGLKDAIAKLSLLRSYDTLYLKIDSLGGSVDEWSKLYEAKVNSKGSLICTIEYEADSAAAMTAQFCDKVYMKPTATILFHMPRYMESGGDNNVRTLKITIINRKTKDLQLYLYYLYAKGLMLKLKVDKAIGKDNWERLLDGEDIVLSAKKYAKNNPKVRIMR